MYLTRMRTTSIDGANDSDIDSPLTDNDEDVQCQTLCSTRALLTFLSKFIIWVALFILFIKIEFGGPFFIISLSVILYKSMKPGSRKEGEPSAYSVFNPNCESIDGLVSKGQHEAELQYLTIHQM